MSGTAPMRRDLSWVPAAGAAMIALVLICQSLWGIWRFWDVFPIGDMVDVVWRYLAGPTRDFWIFHDNEHLPLVVMPLYWIDFRVFSAQGGFLIVCTVVLAIAIALAPMPALRRALPRQRALFVMIACCAVAMQLWLGGYVNLLWTKQVHMYVSLFAVTMALTCVCPMRPVRWFHVAAACAWAAVAMFSFGYGIDVFPVLFVLGVWRRWPWRWIACVVLAAGSCLALYVALSSPLLGHHMRVFLIFSTTARRAAYAFTFIASPVANTLRAFMPETAAFGLADALAALAAGWFAMCIWRRRHRPPSELMAWAVGLALFTIIAACQTAFARSFYGITQAADSRYIVGQIPFWMALLLVSAESVAAEPARRDPGIIGAVACIGMALLLASQQAVLPAMHVRNYERWSSAMSAVDGVHDPLVDRRDDLFYVARDPEMVAGLRARGWSAFAWPQAKWIRRPVASFGEARMDCLGAFDTAVAVGSGFRAEGWAADLKTSARSPWVLLTDSAGFVRGVAHGGGPRGDVTGSLHAPAELYAGWTGYVPAGVERAGLSAWLLMGGKHPCRLGPLPPLPAAP